LIFFPTRSARARASGDDGNEPEPLVAGVASIDKSIEQVRKAGGTQVVEKMAIPGVGFCAYFLDTEGNCFGIFQDDVNAK